MKRKSSGTLIDIAKALQLLEFLIKNGSERVIDDARSHLSLLKMLRQFHYIDQNGKDQGINVRNRSKELADLLGDVDRIRAERKKARANRNKFGGVEGGAMSGGISGSSRYGGFGSEEASYGGYSGGVYGDGGGFGGRDPAFQDSSNRRDRFEEYDEGEEDGGSSAPSRQGVETSSSSTRREIKRAEPTKSKEPDVDFLSFDDDVPPETPPKEFAPNAKKTVPTSSDNGLGSLQTSNPDDDDFDDFQSATPTTTASSKPSIPGLPPSSATNFVASKSTAPSQNANVGNLAGFNVVPAAPSPVTGGIASPPAPNYNISFTSPPPQSKPFASPPPQAPQAQQPKPTSYQAQAPNYFTSVPAPQPQPTQPSSSRPSISSNPSFNSTTSNNNKNTKPGAARGAGGDAFGNLWSSASSSAGIKKSSTGSGAQGPNLASLQREKASQGLWGAAAAPASGAGGMGQQGPGLGTSSAQKSGGSGLDDLLG